jgi:hypothetical protein
MRNSFSAVWNSLAPRGRIDYHHSPRRWVGLTGAVPARMLSFPFLAGPDFEEAELWVVPSTLRVLHCSG